MPLFQFEGKDDKGAQVSGQLEAASEREAARQLHSQGYFVSRLTKERDPAASGRWFSSLGRKVLEPVFLPVSSKALSLFFSSFAAMLAAGMSLHEASSNLGERAHGGTLRKAARAMAEAALHGKPISSITRRYPAAFSSFVIAMLETGEASGKLEGAMRQMADYFQRTHELEMIFRFETFYPKLLVVAVILIPTLPTLVLKGTDVWLKEAYSRTLPVAMGIIALWYGWRLFTRAGIVRRGMDRLKLSLPFIGSIVRRAAVAKWCRAMAMLYGAGVPLHLALQAAGSASGNTALAARTQALAPRVLSGEPVSSIMEESGDFPDLAINMMVTGERSGSVEASLTKVAEYCESETQTASKQSAILIGVVFYLAVAAVIGYMYITAVAGYVNDIFKAADF